MRVSRRRFLRGAALAGGGAAVGLAAVPLKHWLGPDRLPLDGGYAPAMQDVGHLHSPGTSVTYYVKTNEPAVAFTFDDGPGPRWPSLVLDILDAHRVPATFFVVGRNLRDHADLVRRRLDRHEIGNHSWSHPDFARLDLHAVRDEVARAHDEIRSITGRHATLLRPPYAHVGGSTLLAANELGYDIVLWSEKMHESAYRDRPQDQARDIVKHVVPGSIVLAHDVGADDRLVAIRGLADMFSGLRARGFRFVHVSELMALGATVAQPTPGPVV
jgi:peptidoglycan-N-acetylglucosamine deacetylase